MTTLQPIEPRAIELAFHGNLFEVHLEDGRILSVPLDWYPRLERASSQQRKNFQWLGKGMAMHWPDIDEDISVEGLLRGLRAPRSKAYLEGWSEDTLRRRAEIEAKDRAKRSALRAPRKKTVKAKH
jgi:hypothetical protein